MSVQVTDWRTSTYSTSGGGNCVEVGSVADGSGRVAVRDSKDPGGAVLVYGQGDWRAFLSALRGGAFEH